MNVDDHEVHPDEFAEAAAAAIGDALGREPRDAARVLADAGLIGVLAAEGDGGLGLDLAFALPIAEAAGRLQLRFPLVEQMVLARAFAGTPTAAALVSGELLGTIAWQGSRSEGIAGHADQAADCDCVLVADDADADANAAGTGTGDRTAPRDGATLLECASVTLQSDDALDPEAPQAWLQLGGGRVLASLSPDAHARLRRDAQILLAGFVTGAAQGAVTQAATHVATRVQFGRPLSSKQAVRHWLARMQLLVEVSGAATRRTLASDEFGLPRDARPTLAGAIQQAAFVLEKAIHLHGGMGFTWELPLHRSLRAIRKIDAAFGSTALLRTIGQRFIASV